MYEREHVIEKMLYFEKRATQLEVEYMQTRFIFFIRKINLLFEKKVYRCLSNQGATLLLFFKDGREKEMEEEIRYYVNRSDYNYETND